MSEYKKKKMSTEVVVNAVNTKIASEGKLRFAVVSEGVKVPILLVSENECKLLNDDQAAQYIKTFITPYKPLYDINFSNPEAVLLTRAGAVAVLRTAQIDYRLQIDDVKTFAFLSDPCLAFCRIPFDPSDAKQDAPKWDAFLTNFSNVAAVRMWIGSLFFEKSDRSQYLWLYGQGGNGKSTLAKVISRVLGPFMRFEQVPAKDDKFWSYGLIGKRLVVLDDCNNYGFVKTGLFKSLTGSSRVRVEQKGKDSYDADLHCKFLFTSNEMPMVSTEIADQRRLIFSTAINRQSFPYDADFEAGLIDELPQFISNCMLEFSAACGDGRPIPSDQREALELGNCYNEEIEVWFDSAFVADEKSYVLVRNFRKSFESNNLKDHRVYKYLTTRGFERTERKINGISTKVINGLRQNLLLIDNFTE